MPPDTVPQDVLTARTQVAALQQQVDTTLNTQIEAAIQAGDEATVRTLRDSRSGLLSQLYAAKVALLNLETAFYQAQRVAFAAAATQFSNAAQAQMVVADTAKGQADTINAQAARAYEIQQGYDRQLHRATDHLAALQTAETARLRNLAAAAY